MDPAYQTPEAKAKKSRPERPKTKKLSHAIDDWKARRAAKSLVRKYHANVVAGIHEALPFRDEAFDIVLSSYSSVAWAPINYPNTSQRERAVRRMLNETVRVLKPGGEARMTASVHNDHTRDQVKLLRKLMHEIPEKYGDVSWKFTPIHTGGMVELILLIKKEGLAERES